jgi:hypothetical protein
MPTTCKLDAGVGGQLATRRWIGDVYLTQYEDSATRSCYSAGW